MCDYCEKEDGNKSIIVTEANEVIVNIEQKDLVVRYEDWNCLGNGEWGYANASYSIHINYCPMCGRKL